MGDLVIEIFKVIPKVIGVIIILLIPIGFVIAVIEFFQRFVKSVKSSGPAIKAIGIFLLILALSPILVVLAIWSFIEWIITGVYYAHAAEFARRFTRD